MVVPPCDHQGFCMPGASRGPDFGFGDGVGYRSPGVRHCTVIESNRPESPCCFLRQPAPLAQSAERLHGKEKVYGSIP